MKITTEARLTDMMLKGGITSDELIKFNESLQVKALEIENIVTDMFEFH
jgi:hypothetical protein